MKKKIVTSLLLAATTVAVIGCGKNEEQNISSNNITVEDVSEKTGQERGEIALMGLAPYIINSIEEGEITRQEAEIIVELREYYCLLQEGEITQEEYNVIKEEYLAQLEEEFQNAA